MKHLTSDIRKRLLSSLGTANKASEISFLLDDIRAATYIASADLKPLLERLSYYSPEFAATVAGCRGDSLREVVKEAQELVKEAEPIKVEMSYNPSADFAKGLYDIFQSLGYENFLFDFTVTPEVGHGARFYHKGNFLDVSMFDLIKEKIKGINLGM